MPNKAGRISEVEQDHLLIGRIAKVLYPGDLFPSLNEALKLLCEETEADICEIFIAEHEKGDLILSASQGRDRDVGVSYERFRRGSGYPGIVVKNKKPITTTNILRDHRFHRHAIKERGIRSCVAVPLTDFDNGALGSLHLAWRRDDLPLDRMSLLLKHVGIPISSTIFAGLELFRSSLRKDFERTKLEKNREEFHVLLQSLKKNIKADGGALFLLDRENKRIFKTFLDGNTTPFCDGIKNKSVKGCPFLTRFRSILIERNHQNLPDACKNITLKGCAICVPIFSSTQLYGGAILNYEDKNSNMLSHQIVPLMAMAQEIAYMIGHFSSNQQASLMSYPETVERNLEIRCFGGFDILKNGQPISRESFARTKALTMLKILLIRLGKAVSKDSLIDMLWPEAEAETGKNRLHGVVHALRSVIEPHFNEGRWDYVKSEAGRYYFNLESPHQVDFFKFCHLLNKALDPGKKISDEDAIKCLQEAVNLYQGDLFANETDEDYFEVERENLRRLYFTAVSRLVEIRIRKNEFEEVISTLRRALKIDPLREDLHQGLIKVLIRLGRRGEAKEQFQRCVEVIKGELETEPLADTLRLADLL